ncbi:hypothetical protein BDU57DRAFT_522374 [Ampelomyces quisqualis]|uniref:Uncharacterized protein n=1 Tax=Ampelomyces quisqualis TaxID=50730 RepID=A0A6A5QDB5_AMPQU|nr:hypothetical protein BDU57DRAFT_522374 [Ampelomyces quisqualis]
MRLCHTPPGMEKPTTISHLTIIKIISKNYPPSPRTSKLAPSRPPPVYSSSYFSSYFSSYYSSTPSPPPMQHNINLPNTTCSAPNSVPYTQPPSSNEPHLYFAVASYTRHEHTIRHDTTRYKSSCKHQAPKLKSPRPVVVGVVVVVTQRHFLFFFPFFFLGCGWADGQGGGGTHVREVSERE